MISAGCGAGAAAAAAAGGRRRVRNALLPRRLPRATAPGSSSSSSSGGGGGSSHREQQQYEALIEAVAAAGGFVHPALRLEGGGVRAAQAVPPPKGGSLVELPLSLRLTPEAAQELLLPVLNAAGLPTMSLLDAEQQLALAVAWLRKQQVQAAAAAAAGPEAPEGARWLPYVALMPGRVPCGWAKAPEALAADYSAFLWRHGLDLAWWAYFVGQVRSEMHQQADRLAARFGPALGVTAVDVLWALGQVQSRKVEVDSQVLLEPWADLLRHPAAGDAAAAAASRVEVAWTYGLSRAGTAVLSRGSGRRVGGGSGDQQQQQQQQGAAVGADVLLAQGEELWASSSAGGGGDLFAGLVEQQGHLAPLAWYLQHGCVAQGLAGVTMRTSDILDSWRLTVGGGGSGSGSGSSSGGSGGGGGGGSRPTALWDYLTQQYQQDSLTVLAAAPGEHQAALLRLLLSPVEPAAAAAGGGADGGHGGALPAADPLPMIGALDELLLAAIDAAEQAAEEEEEAGSATAGGQ